ncbi:MAG: creatininase family protein [Bacillota bacterium]
MFKGKGRSAGVIFLLLLSYSFIYGQEKQTSKLPVNYEELTALDFRNAVESSGGTCIIPFGILEKHGPHLPLGTDLLDSREVVKRAVKQEYSIIFPQYYFGQIFEAKHQPGTIAYSSKITWDLLQETCNELSRNGIKKIIIVNGHGGNTYFLRYFCQAQLSEKRDYAVILFTPADDPKFAEEVKAKRKTLNDGHAGETETSTMLAHRPDLVHLDKANVQSGDDQKRLNDLQNSFSGIWWYAKFPNHYSGDGSPANKELGEMLINNEADQLVKLIKAVKSNNKILELQNKFYEQSENPLKTEQ